MAKEYIACVELSKILAKANFLIYCPPPILPSQYHAQFYSSGVYDQPTCSSSQLNHAILIVGYGTNEHGKDYWLVKNR